MKVFVNSGMYEIMIFLNSNTDIDRIFILKDEEKYLTFDIGETVDIREHPFPQGIAEFPCILLRAMNLTESTKDKLLSQLKNVSFAIDYIGPPPFYGQRRVILNV